MVCQFEPLSLNRHNIVFTPDLSLKLTTCRKLAHVNIIIIIYLVIAVSVCPSVCQSVSYASQ